MKTIIVNTPPDEPKRGFNTKNTKKSKSFIGSNLNPITMLPIDELFFDFSYSKQSQSPSSVRLNGENLIQY